MFADFAPAATGLGLYATADLDVPGTAPKIPDRVLSWTADQEGYHYVLTPSADPIRVRQPVDLTPHRN